MSEMLTRVGAAILEAESRWTPKSAESKERVMARAALEAMREPTNDMHRAGVEAMSEDLRDGEVPVVPYIWRAMVDAA